MHPPEPPRGPESPESGASGPDPAPALDEALAALTLARCADLDAFEDRVLALATHDDVLGARAAWLLHWNGRTGRFEGARLRPGPVAGPLAAVARDPGRVHGALLEAFRLHRAQPEDLDPLLARAWQGGMPVAGTCGRSGAPWDGVRGAVVPLRLATRPYALAVLEGARGGGLEAFARAAEEAAAAVEHALEARRRARQASALRELGRAVVSSLNLAEVLRLTARLAAQGAGARGSAVYVVAGRGGPRLEASHGPAGQRESLGRALQPAAEEVVARGRARVSEDAPADAGLPAAARERFRSLAVVPLRAGGAVLGALAVYDRATLHAAQPAGFDAGDQEFVNALADLASAALDLAARTDAARAAARRLEELRGRARRRERLAELGERAARVAREARNPLASIAAFARRVHRALAEGAPEREYLEIVVREAERLERLLGDPAEPAGPEAAGLRVESLNPVLQEALQQCGEALVRRRVRLMKRLAPDVPALLLDPARIRQVLRNVVQHAVDRVPVGGRIRVESRRAGEHVVVDVAHDGVRAPGELLEALFVPFASGGEDTGLGAAQRIVREHGGEVRLRSDGGSTVVSFTLPIAQNQDRRRDDDRRVTRGDRRARARAAGGAAAAGPRD